MDYEPEYKEKVALLYKQITLKRIAIVIGILALICYFVPIVVFSPLIDQNLQNPVDTIKSGAIWIFWGIIFGMVFQIVAIKVYIYSERKIFGERIKIFLLLNHIAKLGKEKERYRWLKVLYRLTKNKEDVDEINAEDAIFVKERTSSSYFLSNLETISKKLNHMIKHNRIDSNLKEEIHQLAASVYRRDPDLVNKTETTFSSYSETRAFPDMVDHLKMFSNQKYTGFIIAEIMVIMLVVGIHRYVYSDMQTAVVGFFGLTAANVGGLWAKMSRFPHHKP